MPSTIGVQVRRCLAQKANYQCWTLRRSPRTPESDTDAGAGWKEGNVPLRTKGRKRRTEHRDIQKKGRNGDVLEGSRRTVRCRVFEKSSGG